MDRDRIASIERAVAALIGYELRNEPDHFCGEVTVKVSVFRSGVTGLDSTKHRSNGKEAIAELLKTARTLVGN